MTTKIRGDVKWRVLGPLSNMPQFYEAFGVKPGQAQRRKWCYRGPG